MPVEFAPAARDGGDHRPRDLDDDGAQLRRRLGRHDLGDQPEPRGHHHRRDPRHAEVIVHNPVLAFEQGDEFMQAWYDAEAGKLDPFVLILEAR